MTGMFRSALWTVVCCLALVSLPAPSQPRVRQITIRSAWGGLGPHADTTITIKQAPEGYKRGDDVIAPALVGELVRALRSPVISTPELAPLGVTASWLASHAGSQKPRSNDDPGEPTQGQRALFEKSFTDMKRIERVLPEIFKNWHTDDNPGAKVEVLFEDGTKLEAYSHSQFAYMLPWCVGPDQQASYNPAISRAVAALMPPKIGYIDRTGKFVWGPHAQSDMADD